MSLHPATPAIAAALLFGASTPLAKLLLGEVPPLLLAGLLYLGSGLGLGALLLIRRALNQGRAHSEAAPGIPRGDLPWLCGAILFGGAIAPALLMIGLARTSAASASLLLNLEGVFTALLAWWVFKEGTDRRIVTGMATIVAGGALLSWQPGAAAVQGGAGFILAACLCWAIDNNLTRRVAANDAQLLAGLKGGIAGLCNTALALSMGAAWPAWPSVGYALLIGFLGYGLSLALFVVSLRTLGTARTGAYFSTAPLFGVLLSLAIWPEVPSPQFWVAAGLMAIGLALHLRERHLHEHEHEVMTHSHVHRHDEHHRHVHAGDWKGVEPHVHEHPHEPLRHTHAHHPDIHHRHPH